MEIETRSNQGVVFSELRPQQIQDRRGRTPVGFVPLGTLEWHGEHLPVGLDGLKAERLSTLAARQCDGFVFPTLWYGEPRRVLHMDADQNDSADVRQQIGFLSPADTGLESATHERELFERLIDRILHQLRGFGMRAIVLVAGHHPLYDAARLRIADFNRRYTDTAAAIGIENQFAAGAHQDDHPPLADWFPMTAEYGSDHAAMWETSYQLALMPETVDLGSLEGTPLGVLGEDPRTHASAKKGARAVELTVAGMVAVALELLARTGGQSSQ